MKTALISLGLMIAFLSFHGELSNEAGKNKVAKFYGKVMSLKIN